MLFEKIRVKSSYWRNPFELLNSHVFWSRFKWYDEIFINNYIYWSVVLVFEEIVGWLSALHGNENHCMKSIHVISISFQNFLKNCLRKCMNSYNFEFCFESYCHWAAHLWRLRALEKKSLILKNLNGVPFFWWPIK